ncbi:MAG: alpha/beta hydrolase [Pseudomonadota bacterium]
MIRRFRHAVLDGEMAGVEFGDPLAPLSAVWFHATGFNAMTYQSILAPLGLRARVAAVDLRGHGLTTLPAQPSKLKSWRRYRDDVIAWLTQQLPLEEMGGGRRRRGVVLGGHSMGATVALLVAGERPDLVKGLVLADPVILSPGYYRANHVAPLVAQLTQNASGMVKQARRRRPAFPSPEVAREKYNGRGAFTTWREPFLEDYLLDGLQRVDGGTDADDREQVWSLTCTPAWEAATFGAQRNRPWGALKTVREARTPMIILRAETGSVMSDASVRRLEKQNPGVAVKTCRGTTHFLPMEAPYEVRDTLSAYISRLVEGFSPGEEGPIRRTLDSGERG